MPVDSPAVNTALCWLRRTTLDATAGELLRHLREQRYAGSTIALYLRITAHFGEWLDGRELPLAGISEVLIGEFVGSHLSGCRCSAIREGVRVNHDTKSARAALRHLVEVLHGTGQVAERLSDGSFPPAVAAALDEFDQYLQHVCGAATATRTSRRQHVGAFLSWEFGEAAVVPTALCAGDLRRFLVHRFRMCSAGTVGVIATALRSYLRYLVFRGQVAAGLVEGVPAVARWRRARLPQHLDREQEARFLAAVDRSLPSGRRDYAIFLLMCRLGLRASDVAALTLDDFDWRQGTISVRSAKAKRSHRLPLPAVVAEAVVAYLRDARPDALDRHLFHRHRAPTGRPITAGLIRGAVRRGYSRAGLPACWTGTHRLRHTAAATMLRGGASIKQIADVLAHRSIDTTAIYAKLDLDALRSVPLPWPEGVL